MVDLKRGAVRGKGLVDGRHNRAARGGYVRDRVSVLVPSRSVAVRVFNIFPSCHMHGCDWPQDA